MNYSELYQNLFPHLTGIACIWVTPQDAEDIVQDVLVNLWEKRDSLIFLDDIQAYAFTAVKNRCIDRLRMQSRMRQRYNMMWTQLQNSINWEKPQDIMEYQETKQRLNKAIATLKGRCREVFLLSREEGYHNSEIAQRLGISVNTVECHMTNALRKIREQFRAA
ncbi:MAG: RNA polymerase sigma-70 factor [Prevotella sp.]|jgi:RNA polymerase sigma-70 factor (ECF subfamily)